MSVRWDDLMDSITKHCINNEFKEAFENSAHGEKVALCMRNKYIRDSLEQWLDNVDFNDNLKSSVKSKETRLKANEEFRKDRLELCCKLYTQAAQYAPYKSLELALAFSNRSAMYNRLNKFQDCLKDINASLEILDIIDVNETEINKGQLIVKLSKRKIECLMAINQYKKAQSCWENLLELSKNVYNIPLDDQFVKKCKVLSDSDQNDSIQANVDQPNQPKILSEDLIKKTLDKNGITLPFKSSKMKLCYSEAKGRHFVASKRIEYGELLIFEDPFTFVLIPDYYDSFCYNCCVSVKKYSVPCVYCCAILFCGEKCRKESWESYHRWECQQGTSVFKCIGIAHLALRLTIETLHPNNKNDQIYNLLTHIDDVSTLDLLQYSLTATLLLIFLKKTDFFHCHPQLVLNSVGYELLQHMTRLVCNGNAISTHLLSDYDTEALTSIVDESQPRIGTAIFPTSSLLNHSCDPNIFSSNILKYVVIKASRDIKKGEEITNCYGPNFRRMPIARRQVLLKAQYHFDCKCKVCVDPQKDDKFFQIVEGLVCLTCNYEIKATLADLDDSDSVYCELCPARFRTVEYKKRLIEADKIYTKGLRQLAKHNSSKAIYFIAESLRLYTLVLNQKNSNITKCEDSLAKCFAIAGDYKNCYTYLDRSFGAIEERFGKNSLEVAYELDKMSDLMVNNMNIKNDWRLIRKALAYVRRTMEIFDANLSAWDIPYCESGIKNVKHKENILLQLLEGRPLEI